MAVRLAWLPVGTSDISVGSPIGEFKHEWPPVRHGALLEFVDGASGMGVRVNSETTAGLDTVTS